MEISENGLVTSDGTKVLMIEEFDRLKKLDPQNSKGTDRIECYYGA